jgi:hypothetical protein
MATGWTTFVLAALQALPALIQLLTKLKEHADLQAARGQGYQEAVAATLQKGADMLAEARAAEQQAAREHAAKSDDSAFDREFERRD